MDLDLDLVPPSRRKAKPAPDQDLPFGDIYTDHMLVVTYKEGQGWAKPRIVPFADICLSPAAIVIHYAQSLFEGLKCYRRADGGLQLFRPRDNFRRLNQGAERMCMPSIDSEVALESLRKLLHVEQDWVPCSHGSSLYVRPTLLATEPHLGVRPAREYLYFVILCPVGAYYKEGFNPVTILVSDKYSRAAPGGVGNVKAAGNYAASLYAAREAQALGFTQILWLDAAEHKYIEELGTSNMFFLFEDTLVTPALSGSILPGITRYTVLDLAREWGQLKVEERPVSIEEVMAKAKEGKLTEAFASGTAVVISPVSEIHYKDEHVQIGDGRTGPVARKLFDEITAIQYGAKPDTHGWVERIT
jgi:branched-chain amino acid aminotransferase